MVTGKGNAEHQDLVCRGRRRRLVRGAATAAVSAGLVVGLLGTRLGSVGLAQDAPPTMTPITFTVIDPTATTAPAAAPTSTPAPTEPPAPTATPVPTATPSPTPEAIDLAFTAESWTGAYYRGDGQAYGRPWVSVYGALSEFPRATLTFDLPRAPSELIAFEVVGLDDEWADRNDISIEINGQQAYTGPSPFNDWDGVGNGENAAWTRVTIVFPGSLLQEGSNEIAIANLEPVASYNSPPYVLLSTASLSVAPPELATATALTPVPTASSEGADIVSTIFAGDEGDDDDEDDG